MTFAAAVPGAQGQPLDQIRLDGISATGHHGVLPHERVEGQVFRADVVLHLDTRAAASSDDLAATVSYADVAQDVHDVLAGSPADLVETVAERIAAAVLARPAVHTVDVRVHKPQAPIEVPFDDVSVVVRRDRSHVPAVAPLEPASPAEPVETPSVVPAPVVESSSPAALRQAQEPSVETPPAAPPVDPLDAAPEQPVEAVLALGANLGDAQVTLRDAVTDIDRVPGLQVTDVSPLARTAAVGGPEQPDFLNAVLVVRTTLSPRDLLHALQDVETQHGRVREERWGPRTLDVDIVQYGSLVSSDPELELPHPRARERAFVLVPWAEVAPDAVLGGLGGGVVGQLAVTAPDRAGIRWLALDWLTGPTQSTGQIAAGDAPPQSAPVPRADESPADQSPAEQPLPAEPAPQEPQASAGPQEPEMYVPEQHVPEAYGQGPYVAEPEPYAPRPYAPSGEMPYAQPDRYPEHQVVEHQVTEHHVTEYPAPEQQAPEYPAPEQHAPEYPAPEREQYAPEPYAPEQSYVSEQPYAPEQSYAPEQAYRPEVPAEPASVAPPVPQQSEPQQSEPLPPRVPEASPESRPQPVFRPRETAAPQPVQTPAAYPAPGAPILEVPGAPSSAGVPRPGTDGIVSAVPADLSPHAPVPPPPAADPFAFGASGAGHDERDEGRDR